MRTPTELVTCANGSTCIQAADPNLATMDVPTTGQDAEGVEYASGMPPIRKRKPPRVMGAAEAAAHLGVAQQNLRPIPGLPSPIAQLRCGSIWLADEIEAFAAMKARGVPSEDARAVEVSSGVR